MKLTKENISTTNFETVFIYIIYILLLKVSNFNNFTL